MRCQDVSGGGASPVREAARSGWPEQGAAAARVAVGWVGNAGITSGGRKKEL